MHVWSAPHVASLTVHLRPVLFTNSISHRLPAALRSFRRTQIVCMDHPSGGSYSIWAMPKGELAERLQRDIDRLASEHASPSFQPHVTLLGGTEQSEEDALRITAELAQSLPNLRVQSSEAILLTAQAHRIEFQDVSYGAIFHQCVYVRCKTDGATMDAAQQTRQAFGHPTDAPYMPHLSLLYSDIPAETRAEVAAREQERLFSGDKLPTSGVDVDGISLWHTIGDDKTLKSWRLVEQFALRRT